MSFKCNTIGNHRLGSMSLHRGTVKTPIFMPVGTVGSVKSLDRFDVENIEAQIILANTYHINLRPGMDVVKHFGGLHNFMNWKKPILTDSGGFQVFSLGHLVKLREEGVTFKSHLDGSEISMTPESCVAIQETIGSDIHMVLDECTEYTQDKKRAEDSMERSMRWAKRCRDAKSKAELWQFGIVQGGFFPDLRKRSAESLIETGFEGYAIGGLSVGESKQEMLDTLASSIEHLPSDKPRYLMGVGTPLDILEGINLGVDMFDCVMPTRNARNGCAFTSEGKVIIKNAKYKLSEEPLDPNCDCLTCTNYSKAYLRHLYVSGELSVYRFMSLHNLRYYLNLIHQVRKAIAENSFDALLNHHRNLWS